MDPDVDGMRIRMRGRFGQRRQIFSKKAYIPVIDLLRRTALAPYVGHALYSVMSTVSCLVRIRICLGLGLGSGDGPGATVGIWTDELSHQRLYNDRAVILQVVCHKFHTNDAPGTTPNTRSKDRSSCRIPSITNQGVRPI
jgi:hypothetical protein